MRLSLMGLVLLFVSPLARADVIYEFDKSFAETGGADRDTRVFGFFEALPNQTVTDASGFSDWQVTFQNPAYAELTLRKGEASTFFRISPSASVTTTATEMFWNVPIATNPGDGHQVEFGRDFASNVVSSIGGTVRLLSSNNPTSGRRDRFQAVFKNPGVIAPVAAEGVFSSSQQFGTAVPESSTALVVGSFGLLSLMSRRRKN